jgi:hypothetical protein
VVAISALFVAATPEGHARLEFFSLECDQLTDLCLMIEVVLTRTVVPHRGAYAITWLLPSSLKCQYGDTVSAVML